VRVSSLLILVMVILSPVTANASTEETVRDWTIEKPFLAGALNGLSLNACRACVLGASPLPASAFDPFGLSEQAYDHLKVHAKGPYLFGQSLGFIFTFLLGIGVLRSLLNRLSVDE